MNEFEIVKLVEELMRQNAMKACPSGLYWETSNSVGETSVKNFVHVKIDEKRCTLIGEFFYVTKNGSVHIVNHDNYSYPDETFRKECLNYYRSHGGMPSRTSSQ